MATLKIDTQKIISNIEKMVDILGKYDIEWSLITKVLGGNREILQKLLSHPSIKKVHSIGDSRISNLKAIKSIKPDIVTMYIKPPAITQVKNVVRYADISLNSSFKIIEKMNDESAKLGKKHRVIIMIEMGELREGIIRENILSFYERLFKLDHIIAEGIGTNLGCMYGVEPTYDKLIQLSLYKQLIDAKFGTNLKLISAGSSITLPLVVQNKVPLNANHFRLGETVYLGKTVGSEKRFKNLSTQAFDFEGEIIEIEKKDTIPDGHISEANVGHTADIEIENKQSYKCVVDFGTVDLDVENLVCQDKNVHFLGTTSDMTVYDLGNSKRNYKVGGKLHFYPSYMAVAHLMNSKYVTKKVI